MMRKKREKMCNCYRAGKDQCHVCSALTLAFTLKDSDLKISQDLEINAVRAVLSNVSVSSVYRAKLLL